MAESRSTRPASRTTAAALAVLLAAGCAPAGQQQADRSRAKLASALTPVDPATLAPEQLPAGATVYVPVYSHVYHSDGRTSLQIATTLSIRNTDERHPIILSRIDFYDTAGKLVRRYLERPGRLGPLATAEVLVPDREAGGSGANFLVEWLAGQEVSEPVFEAVMIGTAGTQGISFLSTGRVVSRRAQNAPEHTPGTRP